MKISIPAFSGIRPQRAPQLLEGSEAQTALNAKLASGELRPWDNEQKAADLVLDVIARTIYLYRSQYWLEFTADVNIAEGPIAQDTQFKLYWTGDGIPKKSTFTEITTGAGALPINFYAMASPLPTRQIQTSLGGGGTGDAREILYTWTIVTTWGEESLPATASDVVSALQGQTVNLSNMDTDWQASTSHELNDYVTPTTPNGYMYICVQAGITGGTEPTWGTTVDGDTNDGTAIWRCYENTISAKYIYRFNTGDVAGAFQFVASIPPATTVYADSKNDTELGEILQTGFGDKPFWTPPQQDMIGLVALPQGIMAGFNGKDLYFSEPYFPHAWPEDYSITLDSTIVGLGVMENNLVACTESNPYIITGSTPIAMTSVKMPVSYPCLSKRGIVSYPYGVLYPTTSGLTLVSEGRAQLITDGFFRKKEWADYYPDTMIGAYHDNKYFGFYDTGLLTGECLVVDFQNKYITTLDLGQASSTKYAAAVHVDPKTDTLYYIRQTAEVWLKIGGTSYPNRTEVIKRIGGDGNILLIGDL